MKRQADVLDAVAKRPCNGMGTTTRNGRTTVTVTNGTREHVDSGSTPGTCCARPTVEPLKTVKNEPVVELRRRSGPVNGGEAILVDDVKPSTSKLPPTPTTFPLNGVKTIPGKIYQSPTNGPMQAVLQPQSGKILYVPLSAVRREPPAFPSSTSLTRVTPVGPSVVLRRAPGIPQRQLLVLRKSMPTGLPLPTTNSSPPNSTGNGRVVLPVSTTPLVNHTQFPVQLTTRHFRPNEAQHHQQQQRLVRQHITSPPPPRSASPRVHHLPSGADWREEQKLILELCEHIDNLPSDSYYHFHKTFMSSSCRAVRTLAVKQALAHVHMEVTDKTLEGVEEYLKKKRKRHTSPNTSLSKPLRGAHVQLAPPVSTSLPTNGGCEYAITEPTRPGEAPRIVALVPVEDGEVGDVVVCNGLPPSPKPRFVNGLKPPRRNSVTMRVPKKEPVQSPNTSKAIQAEEEDDDCCDETFLEADSSDDETPVKKEDEGPSVIGNHQQGCISTNFDPFNTSATSNKNKEALLECSSCKCLLPRNVAYNHARLLKLHGSCNARAPKRFPCSDCDKKLPNVEKLCLHLRDYHGRDTHVQDREFVNEAEFEEFLHVLEDKGGNFRKSRGNKATKDAVVYYYICNRVRADSNAELDDKRSTKSDSVVDEEEENTENEDELRIDEDSVELKNGPKPIKCRKNGKKGQVRTETVCSAFYRKTARFDGTVHVRYCNVHLHASEKLKLPNFARERIGLLLRKKMPPQLIFKFLKDRKELLLNGEEDALRRRVMDLTEYDIKRVQLRLRREGLLDEDRRHVPALIDAELWMEAEELDALEKWEEEEQRGLSAWVLWQKEHLEKRREIFSIKEKFRAAEARLNDLNATNVSVKQLSFLKTMLDGALDFLSDPKTAQTEKRQNGTNVSSAREDSSESLPQGGGSPGPSVKQLGSSIIPVTTGRDQRLRRPRKSKTEEASDELQERTRPKRPSRVTNGVSSTIEMDLPPVPLFKAEIKQEIS